MRRPARVILVVGIVVLGGIAPTRAQAAATPFEQSEVAAVKKLGTGIYNEVSLHWQAGEFSRVLALLEAPAARGDPLAQYLLASLHAQGKGVLQDDEQAAMWWRRAAERGLARAQNEIGVALADGRGVEVDAAEAVAWYRKAADQGLAVAQLNLGLMYSEGTGIARNSRLAAHWFRKAADQDMGWAQYFLGEAYVAGRGVSKDAPSAVRWFLKAAEQDYTRAQESLASLYASGAAGVERNDASAVYWQARALRNGSDTAARNLELLLKRMPRVQLQAGLPVRQQARDAAHAIRATTSGGETVHVLARTSEWWQVYLAEGHVVGFVRNKPANAP